MFYHFFKNQRLLSYHPCEGFKTLLEAASCRLPIVTTNVEGVKNMLDNFNGIFGPPRDHISLSIAIEKILQTQGSQILWKNGRKVIQDRFSIKIIKKFLKVYNESLK